MMNGTSVANLDLFDLAIDSIGKRAGRCLDDKGENIVIRVLDRKKLSSEHKGIGDQSIVKGVRPRHKERSSVNGRKHKSEHVDGEIASSIMGLLES